MGTTRVAEARHRHCESQSHRYRGACWRDDNCKHVCNTEGFPSGKCKFHGFESNLGANKNWSSVCLGVFYHIVTVQCSPNTVTTAEWVSVGPPHFGVEKNQEAPMCRSLRTGALFHTGQAGRALPR
uniref:Defensin-like protein n=1 Tax=Aegilops tauschii TaxID=37682 RepID=M8CD99_AEGTA